MIEHTVEWSDQQWANMKANLLSTLLTEKSVRIEFKKIDGTIRTMNCTRHSTIVNEGVQKLLLERSKKNDGKISSNVSSNRTVKENTENLLVWDVDANDWRTIKLKNITNLIELILKYEYTSF